MDYLLQPEKLVLGIAQGNRLWIVSKKNPDYSGLFVVY